MGAYGFASATIIAPLASLQVHRRHNPYPPPRCAAGGGAGENANAPASLRQLISNILLAPYTLGEARLSANRSPQTIQRCMYRLFVCTLWLFSVHCTEKNSLCSLCG